MNVLSNEEAKIKEGFEGIGADVPRLILATMKFFGAARRRKNFAVYNRY